MSKILSGTCVGGVVTALTPIPFVVAGCEILSSGIGASTGIVIIDQDKSYYVANTTPDLSSTLDFVSQLIDTLIVSGNVFMIPIAGMFLQPIVPQLTELVTIQLPLEKIKLELLKTTLK